MDDIRKFALVVVDDFDREIDRFGLDYADAPKNLGFEFQFTTLESRITAFFTSIKEKKLPTSLNVNFLPPNAYAKANAFKAFIQKYMNNRMVFEYNDTTQIKNWEGKVQKFGQEELQDWGGLVCPISFMPVTPKYIRKDNTIRINFSAVGKYYPFRYPYTYGSAVFENNIIDNVYFDEIPLRVTIYGKIENPEVGLIETDSEGKESKYSVVRFSGLVLEEGEHLVIDAIRSKVLLWRNGVYTSAYDYVSKEQGLNTFLFAKGNSVSKLNISINAQETGYLVASYRQYTL